MKKNRKLWAIAFAYKPRGVKVRFKRGPKLVPAHATILPDGTREILTPCPDTRDGLAVFLHECAHIILGHLPLSYDEKPYWQQEWEAEQWTIGVMREHRVPVSRACLASMKANVRQAIQADLAAGRKAPPRRVRLWAGIDYTIRYHRV